jgi:hypothetical protein
MEFLRYVFELKNWNEEDVINDLLDDNLKSQHFFEYNSKKPKV